MDVQPNEIAQSGKHHTEQRDLANEKRERELLASHSHSLTIVLSATPTASANRRSINLAAAQESSAACGEHR